jgi:hypothetical protein
MVLTNPAALDRLSRWLEVWILPLRTLVHRSLESKSLYSITLKNTRKSFENPHRIISIDL